MIIQRFCIAVVYNGDIGCDKDKDSKGISATFVAVYNRDIVCDKDVNNKGVEATFASVYNGDIGY